jgi:hypothetical protein
MTLPTELLAVREIGDEDSTYLSATSADGLQLSLEPGETLLWVGRCSVALLPRRWTLPDDTTVVVTDRRTAFLTTKFDTGGGHVGFGAAGLVVALSANVISKKRAKRRSDGKVAIGHLRHEWVTGVAWRDVKALIVGSNTFLDITVATNEGPAVLQLRGRAVSDGELARWLAGTIAWHRLTLTTELSQADRGFLERLTAASRGEIVAGVSDVTAWQIPANVD